MNNNFFEAQELIKLRYLNINNGKGSAQYLDQIAQFHQQLEGVFLNPNSFSATQFFKYPIHIVLRYLQKTHTFYTNKYLNEIAFMIDGLSIKSSHRSSWKPVLLKIFYEYSQELIRHIEQEENELFPYVNSILNALEKDTSHFSFEPKLKLINHLIHHNDEAEQRLNLLINILENKSDRFDNSLALNVLITKLRIFERDLTIHAKLEDEVLLPRAIELESILSHRSDIIC